MTQIYLSRLSTARAVTGLALLVWLVAAIVGATTGLVNRPGQPPVILLSFIVVPIALGVVASPQPVTAGVDQSFQPDVDGRAAHLAIRRLRVRGGLAVRQAAGRVCDSGRSW